MHFEKVQIFVFSSALFTIELLPRLLVLLSQLPQLSRETFQVGLRLLLISSSVVGPVRSHYVTDAAACLLYTSPSPRDS